MEQRHLTFLQNLLGPERVSVKPTDLDAHSQDESFHPPHPPEVVVWPESAEEISAILHYANRERLPVTPWSGGSSLEGNPIPVYGGILLALYNMNKILAINEADLQVVVQPGVVYDELNARLARYGLFFPPAPGSADVATIGGMAANNSSGMHAVRYGATRDYVLALEVVLPDGRIVRLGKPVIKSASGYDLVRMDRDGSNKLGLFPPEGSEGIQPQDLVWSAGELRDSGNLAIGVIFQQNFWIVDSITGEACQITGDGITSRIDWK